jgi:hypothetical protein
MWKSTGIKLIVASLLILAMLAGGGCGLFNKAPTITSLNPSANSVARGESCTINCVASDPDGDAITYSWSASSGAISGTGNSVSWTAPASVGTYTITVSVSDGKAAAVSESCNIQVVNNPPVIGTLHPSATEIAPSESCTIGCVASDPDGDSLSYAWEASGGTISGTGDTVDWTAPAAEGTYTITVTVSDGQGGSDSESCDITVEKKFGAIDIQSSPAGAAVFLDGVDTGNITPYVITNLNPGSYTVELRLYHYKYRAQAVTVNPNETTHINWSLTYAPELTLTLQPNPAAGKDAYVYDTDPTSNWGTLERITAGSGSGNVVRAYIQFSLTSLPTNAVITSARLSLYYWYSITADVAPIGIYNVTGSWTETGVTWNNQPTFSTSVLYTVNVPAAATNNFINWYITDLVKAWQNGTVANYGVVLKDTDEATAEAWKRFYSSDWGTAAERPKLIIVYFDPTS